MQETAGCRGAIVGFSRLWNESEHNRHEAHAPSEARGMGPLAGRLSALPCGGDKSGPAKTDYFTPSELLHGMVMRHLWGVWMKMFAS